MEILFIVLVVLWSIVFLLLAGLLVIAVADVVSFILEEVRNHFDEKNKTERD